MSYEILTKIVSGVLLFLLVLAGFAGYEEGKQKEQDRIYCKSIGYDGITGNPNYNNFMFSQSVCVKEYDNLTRIYQKIPKEVENDGSR